jgi:dextranase
MQIQGIHPHRSFFLPGEPASFSLEMAAPAAANARLEWSVFHLAKKLDEGALRIHLQPGLQRVELAWKPPETAPRGYGLEVRLLDPDSALLDENSAAFDVLAHWTQHPRYGFLTDFSPGRGDIPETMDLLARYHLNGLQFYDWMYRHDTLMPRDDLYHDPLGRELSLDTVAELITRAHEHQMAAMPYTAVYGASLDFYRAHPDWALYGQDGKPEFFFDFLAIMDPRPGRPWTRHLLGQYERVLIETVFDGIHIDQYGEPRSGYDAAGRAYDLAKPLAAFIAATRRVVDRHRVAGTVIFNAVKNWPLNAVARAPQDIVYIEVWPPDTGFSDLHRITVQAQALGGGKPVVLAAYIDPAAAANVLLADAVIFASGAGHIELGEPRHGAPGYLADPYFPKYAELAPELAAQLLRFYDFAVRYQAVIGPRAKDATPAYRGRIHLSAAGQPVDTSGPGAGSVWPIVRERPGSRPAFTAVSLINLVGLPHADWNEPLPAAPQVLTDLRLELMKVNRRLRGVWLASPDSRELGLKPAAYTLVKGRLQIEIPGLKLWDLVLIQWED